MTKIKLPHNHNGKRPPAPPLDAGSERALMRLRRTSSIRSSRRRSQQQEEEGEEEAAKVYRLNRISSNGCSRRIRWRSIVTLVFISSLLICCCCFVGLLSASQSKASPATTATATQRQVHDSISDSSSSQGATAVSNLSVRSQQLQLLHHQQPKRQQQQHLQPQLQTQNQRGSQPEDERAENKNNLNRLLVERDLSVGATFNRQQPTTTTATSSLDSSDSELPTNHNNNNNGNGDGDSVAVAAAAGEGSLNDETESGGDDSTVDYETSDAATEVASPASVDLPVHESHARPSRQSVVAATATAATTTTTTTRKPETTTTDLRRPNSRGTIQSTTTEPTTFNVNMGSDRLLIKPHNQPQPVTTPTTTTGAPRRFANTTPQLAGRQRVEEPRTSESVNHEFITTRNPYREFSGAPNVANINERRQDLLLSPSNTNSNNNNNNYNRQTTFMPRMGTGYFQPASDQVDSDLVAQQQHQQQSSICYTPFALILVVLMTMLTTLVVCFCTHFLFKHYARRNQFDLVATSRQFDTKHAGQPDQWPAVVQPGGHQLLQATSKHNSSSTGSNNNLLSGLFASDYHHRTDARSSSSGDRRRDDEFAFDNPYFRDEQLRRQQQQQQQQAVAIMATEAPPVGQGDQMNFIHHHISNLHTRQVTSSVKELSALTSAGANNSNNQPAAAQRDLCGGELQAGQVVDLTSLEQRNRIIADPKEGDLIAVDITGHDFIGLGFDVCGSQQEGGIFVRSLLARGPARESGCIEVGDRIKCLNISFESITLQDARDILNCGAPYKMRLLLEKHIVHQSSKSRRGKNSARAILDSYPAAGGKQQPIRACLRKLSNMVNNRTISDYEQQQQQQLGKTTAPNEFDCQQVGGEWLGSAAARQQRALASPFAQAGYLNHAFGGSEGELAMKQQQRQLQQQHERGDTIDSACSVNMRSDRLSSIDSGGGGGARQDVQFAVRRTSSSQQPLSERTDSSLEHFHTQNANHRLHGPGGNNLHLAMDGNSTDDEETSKDQGEANRRRRRRANDGGLSGGHLEQTQSQPEIAPRTGSALANGGGDKRTTTGCFDIDDEDDDDHGRNDHRQQHHKISHLMSSSISTPTINLMPVGPGAGLERRMSSRRQRKDDSRTTINEEQPTAVNNNTSLEDDDTRRTASEQETSVAH